MTLVNERRYAGGDTRPAEERSPARPTPHLVVLVAALAGAAAAMVLAVGAAVGGAAQAPALADPGLLTRWGLLVTRAAHDASAMVTIGVLTVAVVLLPTTAGVLSSDAGRLLRLSTRWSTVWLVSAILGALFALSDAIGAPVWDVLTVDMLSVALNLPQTRALMSTAWLAALVVLFSRYSRSLMGGWLVLAAAVAALLPTLLNAHASHEESHWLGVASLVVHVVAASVWLGGLLALALHLRSSGAALASALPGYSRIALGALLLVGLSGTITASTLLDRVELLWTTAYGQLLVAKVVALLVLGTLGWLHRRRSLAAVAAGRPRAFLVLAATELVLMAATVALAVGLSRTPPPPAEHGVAVPAAAAPNAESQPLTDPASPNG